MHKERRDGALSFDITCSRRGWLRRTAAVVAVATAVFLQVFPTAHANPTPVKLTLWENYGTEINATATKALASAFTVSHPNVIVKVISQPASNYFALLTASVMAHKAPNLAVMWTGLFTLKYQHLLVDLSPLLSSRTLNQMKGIKWASAEFKPNKGVYVVPLEDQFYIGFYNKSLFRKVGLAGPPRTWAELSSDCKKLKAAHVTPMIFGSGSQNLAAEFYPFYDLSYLMAGLYSPAQWKGLYDGAIPWTSPAIVGQVKRWVRLHKTGCTNSNVLTDDNVLNDFSNGKSAMIVKGNWDLPQLYDKLGNNLGVFVPPYSSKPMKAIVQFPGDGFSILKTSSHKKEAAEFLAFVMSAAGQEIIAKTGMVPDRSGFVAQNPLYKDLTEMTGKFTSYPMIDNVIQPSIVDSGSNLLTAAFAGQMPVTKALAKMESTFRALPPTQRGPLYR